MSRPGPRGRRQAMRSRYFVTYDIADDARRTAVFKALRGFGDHMQYSVFRCDLSDQQRAVMIATIDPLIDHSDDQILIVDLGPVDGRASTCVSSLGKTYTNPERRVIIV
jgi:CRISPR-associated protein Cas2